MACLIGLCIGSTGSASLGFIGSTTSGSVESGAPSVVIFPTHQQ